MPTASDESQQSAPGNTTHGAAEGGAYPRQAWDYVEEVVQLLKTVFPLLVLSLETIVDQVAGKFKSSSEEDTYRHLSPDFPPLFVTRRLPASPNHEDRWKAIQNPDPSYTSAACPATDMEHPARAYTPWNVREYVRVRWNIIWRRALGCFMAARLLVSRHVCCPTPPPAPRRTGAYVYTHHVFVPTKPEGRRDERQRI
ncbi:hypothetical protein DFH06DRAFT_1368074 [Mycena polygramma]|nr:hypothetical protein DFH06DRAFT_1368074 [Mycena polygramma]